MEYKAKLFLPNELIKKKKEILSYYKNQISFSMAKEHIYGGKDLTKIVDELGFKVTNEKKLIVTINFYYKKKLILTMSNVSFRQLTIESTNNFLKRPRKSWYSLSTQKRLEICQHELSRWSVIFISKGFMADGIKFSNKNIFKQIEIINNCTTSKGFELKISIKKDVYHASFEMPSQVYRPLCVNQAGSSAKQGWFVDWTKENKTIDKDHGLIDPKNYPDKISNPTFSQIYWEENYHSRKSIKINLRNYAKKEKKLSDGTIHINHGKIDYNRWTAALGNDNEYISKSHHRKLIIAPNNLEFINPPQKYSEILTGTYKFRLPLFLENGLYDITSPTEKSHYSILARMNQYSIYKINNEMQEIILKIKDSKQSELAKIVVGNINIESIPKYPDIMTIDRICFAPRKTTMKYNHYWLPPSIIKKNETTYAFLLTNKNDFIQPESWGLERLILSKNGNGSITIDLFSYERILPIWQGWIL